MKPYLFVKIGGKPAADQVLVKALLGELSKLSKQFWPVLVHGGGAEVSEFSRRLGIEPQIVNGVRNTRPEEMDIVDMVLAGLVNTRLLRWARALGAKPVGLSCVDGALLTAQSLGPVAAENRTGRVLASDTGLLELLCGDGYLPIISSVSDDGLGEGLNINADDAALALAAGVGAASLVYLSDIRGVLKNGELIPRLDPAGCEREIAAGVISGGMIPKVRSACLGLDAGIGRVLIGGFAESGDLARLLDGSTGTSIYGGSK